MWGRGLAPTIEIGTELRMAMNDSYGSVGRPHNTVSWYQRMIRTAVFKISEYIIHVSMNDSDGSV